MMNPFVFNGNLSLDKIVDGTSDTIFFAEGYTNCTYEPTPSATLSQTYHNYSRQWNYDPSNTQPTNTTYATVGGVTTYNYGWTTQLTVCAPYFSIGGASNTAAAISPASTTSGA